MKYPQIKTLVEFVPLVFILMVLGASRVGMDSMQQQLELAHVHRALVANNPLLTALLALLALLGLSLVKVVLVRLVLHIRCLLKVHVVVNYVVPGISQILLKLNANCVLLVLSLMITALANLLMVVPQSPIPFISVTIRHLPPPSFLGLLLCFYCSFLSRSK